MSSLAFIVVTSAKNRLLEILRKPAKLILYLFVIAVIAGLFITSLFTRNTAESFIDIVWLKGIIFAFILLFFTVSVIKGLKSGDAIFDMSDVNFLFVSPLRPQSILLYGIVRMIGMSFWAGFFILFQGNSLGMLFGINFGDLLIILGGFILAVSLMQIVSLIIYSLTNGNPKRKMFTRLISFAVFLPMILNGIYQLTQAGGNLIIALESLLRSPVTAWIPVSGWVAESTAAFISGNLMTGFLFLGVTLTSGALLIVYIRKSNPDYYEDTLVATETAFEKKRAAAEGQVNMEALSGKKVKINATGINGSGASSIFYKHLRESFRANRLGLWGMMSIIMILISGIIAFIFRMTNESGSGLITILQALMWMQIFVISTGRGLKEIYSHHIYMIPEPPFKKIAWSNMEVVFKVAVESVLAFGIAGVIMNEQPILIIEAIAVFTLFSLMLIAVNYLALRWTGVDISAGFLLLIYIFAVLIIMLPGVIGALAAGYMIAGVGVPIGLLILAAWELLAACGCFALSQGILHKCDMPVVKMGNK